MHVTKKTQQMICILGNGEEMTLISKRYQPAFLKHYK